MHFSLAFSLNNHSIKNSKNKYIMKRRKFLKISSMIPVLSMIDPIGYKIEYKTSNNYNQTFNDPLQIDTRKQLLLNEKLIQSTKNIKLNMNTPHQDGQLLLAANQSWEQSIHLYSSILKGDKKFKLWYSLRTINENLRVGYAESNDGIHFEKPNLGRYKINGSKKNNIVFPPEANGGSSVWIDLQASDKHKYKTQSKVYPSNQFHMFSSPDGIYWESLHNHHLDIGDCDTQSVVFWDQSLQQYVLYTREWIRKGDQSRLSERRKNNYRIHRRLTSRDLEHWNNSVRVLEPNATDFKKYNLPAGYTKPPVDYYGATVFRYPDAEGLYIMLANAFWHWYDGSSIYNKNLLGPQSMDVRLAISYDGVNFRGIGSWKPFLRNGPEGSFSSREIWAIPWPIQVNNELWFYYSGSNRDHAGRRDPSADQNKNGIGRAILRLDGFVSADAEYSRGELLTQPLKFQGEILKLNVDTSAGGSVFVEMLDNQGNPIQGFTKNDCIPVVGNSVSMPVRWKGGNNLRELNNKPVQLRFYMKDSKLYAFQFTSKP